MKFAIASLLSLCTAAWAAPASSAGDANLLARRGCYINDPNPITFTTPFSVAPSCNDALDETIAGQLTVTIKGFFDVEPNGNENSGSSVVAHGTGIGDVTGSTYTYDSSFCSKTKVRHSRTFSVQRSLVRIKTRGYREFKRSLDLSFTVNPDKTVTVHEAQTVCA